jgi:hypothetical protein
MSSSDAGKPPQAAAEPPAPPAPPATELAATPAAPPAPPATKPAATPAAPAASSSESTDITAAKLLLKAVQFALCISLFYLAAKEAYRIRLYAIEVRGRGPAWPRVF